ncbi:hypothetical protein BB427_15495 [Pseudoalteromonas sp. BMB]|uniref:hypothetical protein n=1 Tax=Pseudoalteromonas sp. BMB TaxID=1874619 RepID=UPI00083D75DE|nr:hypothetical protein [Pseudoalteromonas sp. BMB]ODB36485.1 hypothetical protein BB427_15495 [Pseudoalteromonas sp. BMB]
MKYLILLFLVALIISFESYGKTLCWQVKNKDGETKVICIEFNSTPTVIAGPSGSNKMIIPWADNTGNIYVSVTEIDPSIAKRSGVVTEEMLSSQYKGLVVKNVDGVRQALKSKNTDGTLLKSENLSEGIGALIMKDGMLDAWQNIKGSKVLAEIELKGEVVNVSEINSKTSQFLVLEEKQ